MNPFYRRKQEQEKLTYASEIEYLRSHHIPIEVIERNHQNGFSYYAQARAHQAILNDKQALLIDQEL